MKRLFFVAVAIATMMSYTASAQFKLDKAGITKKIEKSNADTQNAKKGLKAATWITRGDNYFEAATASTNGLYVGMEKSAATVMYGTEAKGEVVEIQGKQYEKYTFPYFDAYFGEGKLVFWEPTVTVVSGDPIGVAIESYTTAAEKDPKAAGKAKEKLTAISDYYKTIGGNYFQAQKFKEAATEFEKSYHVCALPTVGVVDTMAIYNAGYLYTATNEYQKGIDALDIAASHNYDGDGQSYFFRGICYIGLEKYDEAKAILLEGISKYPSNNEIVEGIMSLYATTGDDPKEIIPYVEKAIEADPTNYIYYDGLGRIYDKMGDNDKCLEAFEKAAELAPKEFTAQFNLGMLYIRKANSMYDVIREIPNASQEDYANALNQQIEYFKNSIEPLEKALELNANSVEAAEALKNVCFRLRDDAAFQAKYDKYNEMVKAMKQ